MLGLYDMMDQAIANDLGISVEEYVNRVEWILEKDLERGKELMMGIFDESKEAHEQFLKETENYNDGQS
jgi:hypothetical protein